MCNNPSSITIPAGFNVTFFGSTNSGFEQIVTIKQGSSVLHTFSGSGEGTPFSSTFKWTSNGKPVSLTFQANSGSGPYDVKVIECTSQWGRQSGYAEFVTEDWVDHDNNDTILSVMGGTVAS